MSAEKLPRFFEEQLPTLEVRITTGTEAGSITLGGTLIFEEGVQGVARGFCDESLTSVGCYLVVTLHTRYFIVKDISSG